MPQGLLVNHHADSYGREQHQDEDRVNGPAVKSRINYLTDRPTVEQAHYYQGNSNDFGKLDAGIVIQTHDVDLEEIVPAKNDQKEIEISEFHLVCPEMPLAEPCLLKRCRSVIKSANIIGCNPDDYHSGPKSFNS